MTTEVITSRKLNSRQKLVLINALKGMNQTDAYEAVYGQNPNSYTIASELFRKPHFKAELERLQNKQIEAVDAQVLSKSEKRQILATFARAQLTDLIGEDGIPRLDKNSPAAKALKEWYRKERVDRNGNPIVTSALKLIDPIAAIIEDNKMTGDYAPSKHLHGHRVQFDINLVERGKRGDE